MKKLLLSLFLGSLMSMTLAAEIPQQQFNQSLYDQLPDSVKKAGVIRNVLDGSFPPSRLIKKSLEQWLTLRKHFPRCWA